MLILHPKLRGKISTNSQINPITLDENRKSQVRTIKILVENSAYASIIRKDVFTNVREFLKIKKIKSQLSQGILTLFS